MFPSTEIMGLGETFSNTALLILLSRRHGGAGLIRTQPREWLSETSRVLTKMAKVDWLRNSGSLLSVYDLDSRLAQEHFIVLIPMPSAASGTIKTGRKQEPARSFTSIASNWTRPQETVADGFLAIINLHNIFLSLDINQRQSDSLPQRFNLDMFHWIWCCSRTCNWPLASEHGCGCRLGKFWPFIATRRC